MICLLYSLGDSSPQESMENWVDEKRVRREIANSNERRRMQSINSGFQSLRTLLPQSEGEKLSKVETVWFWLHSFDVQLKIL